MTPTYYLTSFFLCVQVVLAANYCGNSYSDAFKCETGCPQGIDSECPSSETCYADVSCSSSENYCGSSFSDADKCETSCPQGLDGECPSGEGCFASVSCSDDPTLSGFPGKLVDKAKAEHGNYGGLEECGSGSMRARVGEYWEFLGRDSLDGCDTDVPWSAAFISYMVHVSGGGERFAYSAGHRVYIKSAFAGGRGLYNSVEDIDSATIEAGDLACIGRSYVSDWSYSDFVDWYQDGASETIPTHCDIVVDVSDGSFETIGGNLGNTVQRRSRSTSNYAILLPVTRS